MSHTFAKSLAAAGNNGLTYKAIDPVLPKIYAQVDILRKQQGWIIKEHKESAKFHNPRDRRVRFVAEVEGL